MLPDMEKAYYRALRALKAKDYPAASGFFRVAENKFAEKSDFRILRDATELLLAVKNEIFDLESRRVEIEENVTDGKETEFR